MKRVHWVLPILAVLLFAFGCEKMGQVVQGRTVNFDKDKKEVLLVTDVSKQEGKTDYSGVPPIVFKLPDDPNEMGPEPKAGYRMKLDVKKNQIVVYDPQTQGLKNIEIKVIENKDQVQKDDPLVKDKKFPVVDREKKTISVYSGRQKILTVFSVPDEYFALPDKTWDSGDDVRIYYKEPGKAQRFMNVSKTDIFKK